MSDRPLGKVVVTGASGFIGRHLLAALTAEPGEVVALTRSSARSSARSADVGGRVRWVPLDLKDGAALARWFARERPDTVIHLAGTRGRPEPGDGGGQPGQPFSPTVACAEWNVSLTVRVLDAAARAGAGRVVIPGSAAEYGDQVGPLHEGLPSRATTPYGISRSAATAFALTMHARERCPVVVVRMFTCYGPGQPADMFAADAVAHAVRDEPFEMSRGLHRQDLVHVGDAVRALVAAARRPGVEGRVINVGSGRDYALRDVARLVWSLSGTAAELRIGARGVPAFEYQHDTSAQITEAEQLLGWKPAVGLADGLRMMIDRVRAEAANATYTQTKGET